MISVCMATYNGERFIKEQIDSILSQVDSNDELIISDDGSTDKTLEIIAAFNDKRIKVLNHSYTGRKYKDPVFMRMVLVADNFMNAVAAANGDFIFTADQDDIWKSNKVKICINNLNSADCLVHSCTVFNEETGSIFEMSPIKPTNLFYFLLFPNVMGCCMVFKKNLLPYILKKPVFPLEYDTWIWICGKKYGKTKFLKDSLIRYRRHGNNASPCSEKSRNSIFQKIRRRLYIWRALL